MTVQHKDINQYWDGFYKDKTLGVEDVPSQFAAFVVGEFSQREAIVDIGCGSGRDSFLFARHFSKVLGIDASKIAIDYCMKKKIYSAANNTDFCNADLSDLDRFMGSAWKKIEQLREPVVYARFFIHAIDEKAERNFFKIGGLVSKKKGAVAVEFRTHRDELQQKETSSHFRRYINPLEFMERARAAGLTLAYFTEGFGLAKYKKDDAHVARFVFSGRE